MALFPLFSAAIFLLMSNSVAVDTIPAYQTLKDGNTIVSKGQIFELGFFSLGNSKNRYLGIWYKKIPVFTVVWVANRDTPVTDTSGMFKVDKDGNLKILSGGKSLIWSSNATVAAQNGSVPVAELLDTGNLVVWDKNTNIDRKYPIWESFDYPGDTLLPGMKFGKDLVTGRERYIRSWKAPDDPSPGLYSHWIDMNGFPQVFVSEGVVLQSRLGPWTGLGFSGHPIDIPNPIYSSEFVVNTTEVYFKYELTAPIVHRIVLMWDGKMLQTHWSERTQQWAVYQDVGAGNYGRYGVCGAYGSCNIGKRPPCSCMEGFEPRLPEEWEASDWSSGCQRKKGLNCGKGDGFLKISGLKLPDTRRSWYNQSMSLGECEMECRRNCSCTAFTNLDIRNGGNGCLMWFDELMDITECDDGQELYVKTAELAAKLHDALTEGDKIIKSSFNKTEGTLAVVLLTSLVVLLMFVVAYSYLTRYKSSHMKHRGNWCVLGKKNTNVEMEDLEELPFYSLHVIVKATDNFSTNNKIGEGGFGPVYKGVLEDGREVAVKRLSERSQQGLDEFKNEVICIAKLQHRNLVKLLGYCIHAKELILIYEYMTNKSLDLYLFDGTRSQMLDWSQRFCIIHGMARGILYLHQDSRVQIIHRDLKAGNILLDADMNPKISDFGLARKFVGSDIAAKTKKVVGSYGYIPPEYAIHGRFSTKSDVFSFGVLVLEIVSGSKNREFSHEDHSDNLLGHAWRLFKEGRSIELLCASLQNSCIISEVVRVIHVALLCVQHHAKHRPTMLSVILMLISEGALPPPKHPAYFTDEIYSKLESEPSIHEYMITRLYGR